MDIVVAGIAVMAFAATVFVLAGAAGRARPDSVRTVLLPEGEEWLTVAELAAELGVSEGEIGALVERGDVPFFLVRGGELSSPEYWRFRRDEIDAWTIG
jgi:excisionase family DNA binding protein